MVLFDVVADQLEAALVAVEEKLLSLEGEGLLRAGQSAAELVKAVSVTSDLKQAMDGAEYVQVYWSY